LFVDGELQKYSPLDASELEENLLVQLYPPLQDPQKYLCKVKVKISIRLFVMFATTSFML
jgi:hypothetical protein